MNKYITEKSKKLFDETKEYLVDGVGSSFHVASYQTYPIAIDYGKGSKVYDIDGNEYIDYIAGFGPMLLGYCPQSINEAVIQQLNKGTHFSAPTDSLYRLTKKLTEIIPSAEMVTLHNSGTEAVMYALRLARAKTGKYKVIKFEGQYHGWSDEEKISIDATSIEELGDRNQPNKIIHSKGQRISSADDLIVLPWNDIDVVQGALESKSDEIAAIIMEPIMCDSGPIFPKEGYLQEIRELTKKYHVLLIFDEVITGFRCSLGGAQAVLGVTPDLSTFAKAIASGYPFGAVCGKKEIMGCGTHASGTFNGNPVGTVAALATIEELEKPGIYEHLQAVGNSLVNGFKKLGVKYNIKVFAEAIGGIFALYFGYEENVYDFRAFLNQADTNLYQKFIAGCEQYGVRFTDRRGREYISTEHTQLDVKRTLEVADKVLAEILN